MSIPESEATGVPSWNRLGLAASRPATGGVPEDDEDLDDEDNEDDDDDDDEDDDEEDLDEDELDDDDLDEDDDEDA